MCISFEEEQARRKALLLAIAMLDEMAPRYGTWLIIDFFETLHTA
jgi:hypothetical protein